MGAEVLLPLAIAGAGTAATTINSEQAARRADQITAQGIRQQGLRQRDVDSRVDQEVAKVAGSNPDAEREAAQAQYLDQLRRSRAAARGAPGVPGASDRYNEDVLAGNDQVDSTAARVADLMARANAPLLQRQGELQGLDRLQSDVGTISRAAAGDAFLNQLRARAVRPNPFVDALGQLAQGYGFSRAAGASAGRAGGRAALDTTRLVPNNAGGGIALPNPANPWAPIPYK